MIISQQRWINNQAQLIKIMREQNPSGATLAQIPEYGDPQQLTPIQPPQTINWSFTVPLERILNPPRALSSGQSFRKRDTTQMTFQPPYPSKTLNQNSANTPFILSFHNHIFKELMYINLQVSYPKTLNNERHQILSWFDQVTTTLQLLSITHLNPFVWWEASLCLHHPFLKCSDWIECWVDICIIPSTQV